MKKICILSNNQTFLDDLSQQLIKADDNIEIISDISEESEAFFIDEELIYV